MTDPIDPFAAIAALESTGDYRVLRRLLPRPTGELVASSSTRIALFLDTETTGTDAATDEIIELAMVPFAYSLDGTIQAVGAPFTALNEPTQPIPPEITALTGITQEMVAGHRIDAAAVEKAVSSVALIIAHNAAFDRQFVERSWKIFEAKPWACSMSQIPWNEEGFDGVKLRYLAMLSGFFYDAHRASADCDAAIELLSRPLPRSQRKALAVLLEAARQATYRIWAEKAPFEQKEVLKRRGYRWSGDSGRPARCWYIDVSDDGIPSEVEFLCKEIYHEERDLQIDKITALDRYSIRTSSCA